MVNIIIDKPLPHHSEYHGTTFQIENSSIEKYKAIADDDAVLYYRHNPILKRETSIIGGDETIDERPEIQKIPQPIHAHQDFSPINGDEKAGLLLFEVSNPGKANEAARGLKLQTRAYLDHFWRLGSLDAVCKVYTDKPDEKYSFAKNELKLLEVDGMPTVRDTIEEENAAGAFYNAYVPIDSQEASTGQEQPLVAQEQGTVESDYADKLEQAAFRYSSAVDMASDSAKKLFRIASKGSEAAKDLQGAFDRLGNSDAYTIESDEDAFIEFTFWCVQAANNRFNAISNLASHHAYSVSQVSTTNDVLKKLLLDIVLDNCHQFDSILYEAKELTKLGAMELGDESNAHVFNFNSGKGWYRDFSKTQIINTEEEEDDAS